MARAVVVPFPLRPMGRRSTSKQEIGAAMRSILFLGQGSVASGRWCPPIAEQAAKELLVPVQVDASEVHARWTDGWMVKSGTGYATTRPPGHVPFESSRVESSGHLPRLGCIHGEEGPSTCIAVWCQVGRPFGLQREGAGAFKLVAPDREAAIGKIGALVRWMPPISHLHGRWVAPSRVSHQLSSLEVRTTQTRGGAHCAVAIPKYLPSPVARLLVFPSSTLGIKFGACSDTMFIPNSGTCLSISLLRRHVCFDYG
jgi:hypothetical protein